MLEYVGAHYATLAAASAAAFIIIVGYVSVADALQRTRGRD